MGKLSSLGRAPMSDTMPQAPTFSDTQILQLLDAAHETVAVVPVCWLVTRSLEGGDKRPGGQFFGRAARV